MSRLTHCDFGDCNAATADEREGWMSVDGYVHSTGMFMNFQVCPERASKMFDGLNRRNVQFRLNVIPETSAPTP